MEPEAVKHLTFVPRCRSSKCGRKIRIRFFDEHVIEIKLVDEGVNYTWVEGRRFDESEEAQAHAAGELEIATKVADQFFDWLNGAKIFNGIDS